MGIAMQSKLADQNEATVQLIRFAPYTSRAHTLAQPIWQGPLPQPVKAILTRDALAAHLRDWYARWATNFAQLTDEFLVHAYEAEVDRIKKLTRDQWTGFPFVEWHHC